MDRMEVGNKSPDISLGVEVGRAQGNINLPDLMRIAGLGNERNLACK